MNNLSLHEECLFNISFQDWLCIWSFGTTMTKFDLQDSEELLEWMI